MLFNSHAFILGFLPLALCGFFLLGKHSHRIAASWLTLASLVFYSWWDVRFLPLLLGSIAFNYGAGYLIARSVAAHRHRRARVQIVLAIATDLALLGYFKYVNFFVDTFNAATGSAFDITQIVLPIGISFFTFTQIAFLADTYQGKVKEYDFVHYALFVSYFPHLVAGPILHHSEMMPQFADRRIYRVNWDNIAVGSSIFVLGLTKKLLIADPAGAIATPVFNAAAVAGSNPAFAESWIGALAYTLQLYFDFSAYSDMAIGLSLMFNVRIPLNFNSPYKSTSIIEFWRRWHMTLSRFLRHYLYIPLGGSRKGSFRHYANLMITMLLGGMWHGAGWTFIIWGGLHGLYLLVNHAFRAVRARFGWNASGPLTKVVAGGLTFLAVVVGWVFFRAPDITTAMALLCGMAGINGIGHAPALVHKVLILSVGFAIAFGMPNVHEMFREYRPTCDDLKGKTTDRVRHLRFIRWTPSPLQAACYGSMFMFLLIYMVAAPESEFLYFRF